MPNVQERRWSVEDVWALPEDPARRYETVDGELLVSPMPRFVHQRAVTKIGGALMGYVEAQRLGEVMFSPYDVVLDPFTLMQPDVVVIHPVGLDVVRGEVPPPAPFLAVEVLSPSTVRSDRLRKRPRYQRAGIECWLVDLESELIERWTPDADRPEICAGTLVWHPTGAGSAFGLEVPIFMRQVLGPPNLLADPLP
ncbi:Uma2 family endonuclease [Gemmatimonas sp.]|uniref:Uma2 family endonuclease n=1 Tax=Gemmatimonas sp. TaxID=1962908 RepID=UPI003DA37740